ncbi:HAD-IIIA family hydrolase [Catellatospora sp. NPDC049609]|uniref:HAD-IIIA family hydrolase n=1 Tax=Catellatospora sp. NPDC049609 TaxID=3155505 RepID=UPI0034434AC3
MAKQEITGGSRGLYDAVLLDRDNTLIREVPRIDHPDLVVPMPGVREALELLRAAGLRIGVVCDQPAIGFGYTTRAQAEAVNKHIERLLGPFDTWQMCCHTPADGCGCRKPAPGLITAAARDLGVPPHRCVMIGDIGPDLQAAAAAGATGLLVPTGQTCVAEIDSAPHRAPSLQGAAEWILARQRLMRPGPPGGTGHVLAVCPDSTGDVLLAGPALRALAARARSVSLLTGSRGAAAGRLLPGVTRVVEWRAPGHDDGPGGHVARSAVDALVDTLQCWQTDEAVVFTAAGQSPLPTARLLRMAGVRRVCAVAEERPGSLLDLGHRVPADLPEAQRALSLAAAAGYPLPDGDDGRLLTKLPAPAARGGRIVVHPGAGAPARGLPRKWAVEAVRALALSGRDVVVTGAPDEADLTAEVAGDLAGDLGGRTDLLGLARLLAGAACVVTGNAGPAHLAAALGTPVVSVFAPTVPYARRGPYGTPHVRLGDPQAPCRGTGYLTCTLPGHPCLGEIDTAEVVAAVELLTGPPVT